MNNMEGQQSIAVEKTKNPEEDISDLFTDVPELALRRTSENPNFYNLSERN